MTSAAIEPRSPTFSDRDVERASRFGAPARYADGARVYEAGRPSPGLVVVLSGHIDVVARDGLGHVQPLVVHGPGNFLGELAQLSDDHLALVDAEARGAVEALVLAPERLRALIIAEAGLGERIMRALILRRLRLMESGATGPALIGVPGSPSVVRLQTYLARNGVPHHLLDPTDDAEASDVLAHARPAPEELPLVICADGTMLRNPSEVELARALGLVRAAGKKTVYDVAVVGCGPAGLATAVYGASEGLSVAVLDGRAFGGQAGASMRIENYLGFPSGITGFDLAGRAFAQATKFGAEMLIPVRATKLDCTRADGSFALSLDSGEILRARAVVVASGACYRRPAIEDLAAFEGRGVWYWASPIEARLCAGRDVAIVGGGNSAGQAAVFLADHAARVRMMVRADGLAASMSRYLIDRIAATPNVTLMTRTEVTRLEGSPERGLERIAWRDQRGGDEATAEVGNLFLFVGADPATRWLAGCGVRLDRSGFVVTGLDGAGDPLESTVPGVFAVGDVRAGSIKRVGGAIGEGARAVAALHRFLAEGRPAAVA